MEEKGIAYQYKEEDLNNPQRSQLVLEMNPVRKSVPILVHEGIPVCDSVAILEYIDEVWKDGFPLLLPEDPYERATARFWTHFIDNKVSFMVTYVLKGHICHFIHYLVYPPTHPKILSYFIALLLLPKCQVLKIQYN